VPTGKLCVLPLEEENHIFLVIEQGMQLLRRGAFSLSNKNSTFPRVDGPTQRRSVCVDRKTTFFPVKRGKAKKMGLCASKRGLSGLCSLDPFASCKAIRTNESEIPAPRVDRLGGYFDCVQDLKTRFTRFLGFFWPVTGQTASPSPAKNTVFSRFIVRPERLTKGAGRSKRPRKAQRSP
jgi:hypothetical protein